MGINHINLRECWPWGHRGFALLWYFLSVPKADLCPPWLGGGVLGVGQGEGSGTVKGDWSIPAPAGPSPKARGTYEARREGSITFSRPALQGSAEAGSLCLLSYLSRDPWQVWECSKL